MHTATFDFDASNFEERYLVMKNNLFLIYEKAPFINKFLANISDSNTTNKFNLLQF